MLVELLSQSNYQSFNIKLAQLLGLESSIYLSALIDINEKAYRKDKILDGFFVVDRDYVEKRTTLNKTRQSKIESELSRVGILQLSNERIKINLEILTSLVLEENEDIRKDLSSFRKAATAKSKGDYILNAVKNNIDQTLPEELQQAYSNWLDSVYSKFNFINKQTLFNAQVEVNNAANHDLDAAINIINIAAANGWKDMKWAVKVYKERYTNSGVIENKDVNVDWSTSY